MFRSQNEIRSTGILVWRHHCSLFHPEFPKGKGVMYNGDEEGPGQEGKEDHQKEITEAR
jgi:hypothetical protein